jgi:hypothetical protein
MYEMKKEAGGFNMENRSDFQAAAEKYTSSIVKDIILSIITCGLYYLFWQAREMRAINYLIEEEKYNFWKWLLLTIITCNIYHIYYEYIFAQSIMGAQRKFGRPVSNNLHILSVIVAILGLSIVADAIQQDEINKLFGK